MGPTLHFWYSILNKLVPAGGATGETSVLGGIGIRIGEFGHAAKVPD